jgi:hypothetical protein
VETKLAAKRQEVLRNSGARQKEIANASPLIL